MPITVIGGEQRGDEGKGRFVDLLAEEHDIVARFNGGPNAGHTVILPDNTELDLHGIPSGVAHPDVVNIIGNGVLIDPVKLDAEIEGIREKGIELTGGEDGNLRISSAAHLILPHHISADEIREGGSGGQGSTKSGIAQCASDKYMRNGVRAEIINNDPGKLYEIVLEGLRPHRELREELELDAIDEEAVARQYVESAKRFGEFVTDTVFYLNGKLRENARVLAEGAQAFLLDIDHGMYPYTTSSSPISGGVSTGLGVPAKYIEHTIGVSKIPQSHVGGGPFPTEIHDPELLGRLHGDLDAVDAEKGTTTQRTRRLGYLDIPAIRRSQMVSGTDEAAITKLDWVSRFGDDLKVCVAYERKGNIYKIAPDAAYKLEQSEPIYAELPNWDEDIQGVREFDELPMAAQGLIKFIEEETGVPITRVGVGPRRDQYIQR